VINKRANKSLQPTAYGLGWARSSLRLRLRRWLHLVVMAILPLRRRVSSPTGAARGRWGARARAPAGPVQKRALWDSYPPRDAQFLASGRSTAGHGQTRVTVTSLWQTPYA
jgi:hypothetical protein